MALTWTLKLKDGMSGPAENAANALGTLERKLKGVKGATKQSTKEFDKIAPKFGRFSKFVGKALGASTRAIKGLVKEGGRLDGWVQKIAARSPRFGVAMFRAQQALTGFLDKWPRAVKWAQKAEQAWGKYGGAVKKVGAGLGKFAVTGAAMAIGAAVAVGAAIGTVISQAADFQSNKAKSIFAFDKLLGGPDAAARAWDSVRAASEKTRTSLSETAASFQGLLSAGFSLPETDTLFRQLADLKTLNPQANIDGIVRALAQVRSKGKLTAEELHGQLGDNGLNIGLVYEQLGKTLGKTRDEVAKLMEAGKIDSKTGIAAIRAVISKQTGGADPGSVAGKAPKSFAESIAYARDQFFDLLKLDFSPFFALFERLSKSEGAKKFGAAVEKIMGSLSDPKVLGFVEKFIDKVGGDFFEGFADGFAETMKVFADFDEGDMEDMASVAKDLGKALGVVAGTLLGVSQACAALWGWLGMMNTKLSESTGAVLSFKAALSALTPGLAIYDAVTAEKEDAAGGGEEVGSGIVSGIIQGILGNAGGITAAVARVTQNALGSAKSDLEIGSPSKVFDREVGRQIPAGMARGVRKGESEATDATSRMGFRAAEAGRRLSQVINNTTSSSRTQNNTINFNGGGADAANANRMVSTLRTLDLQRAS